ncbi:amino acid adenylation domain-containing protein [Nitrosovibrio sp. Nv17]|nr:amino acid adenylation domain-containing protein [Nitrosovibrio sp. Nv17]
MGRQDNFFELGGDSILSLQIVARLRRAGWKVTPRQLFERQSVMGMAGVAERADAADAAAAPPAPESRPAQRLERYLSAVRMRELAIDPGSLEDAYPLSPMQKGMLLSSIDSTDTESGLYMNQLNVEVEGLDVDRFERAFREVIRRHAILRTGFLWQAGPDPLDQPLQLVHRHAGFAIRMDDWRGAAIDEGRIAAFAAAELCRSFDILKAPLMRVALIRLDDTRHRLVWTLHHILLDGWSMSRLVNELFACYDGRRLPPPGPPYSNYIDWLAQQDAQADERFWKDSLSRLDGPTLLAGDVLPGRSGYAKRYSRLGPDRTRSYEALARRERVTLNTLVQAAWGLLLQRHARAEAAVFGATVAGRPAGLPGAEEMLGLFINTLPIVVDARPEQRVGDWLRELQARNLEWREHEHTPLYEIQRWAGSAGRALFDSILVFENFPLEKSLHGQEGAGLRFGPVEGEGLTGYAMDLQVVIDDGSLEIEYCYDRSRFTDTAVAEIRRQMEHLLEQMAQDADEVVGNLDWMEPAARDRLFAWGRGDKRYPSGVPVYRLIERRAASRPDAIALLLGDEELSYGVLNERANRLAHRLAESGVMPEVRVGVALERSLDMIVALLAVLKAGGAYVPLDTDYPAERLGYMVRDSGMRLVLTRERLASRLGLPDHVEMLALDRIDLHDASTHNPEVATAPRNLAYLIYTSGSTGQPKGVAVEHGPLAMHCQATAEIYEMESSWREFQFMSFSFDGAHERWLTTLITGAGMALRDGELWPAEQSCRALRRYGITHAVFPPAYLGQLAEWVEGREERPAMELYVFGGEAMPRATFERVRRSLRPRMLINGYGPTETVVTPLIWKVDAGTSFEGAYAPIGKPVGERTAYVLDGSLQPVPQGMAGELYIGGFGLARGYHGRPGLTAERFVADPFDAAGGRLYRTGDLARWLPDGTVEYLGRIDHQVKIRGFRIELGEIESRLLAIEGVAQAAAVVQGSAPETVQQLVAYVVPAVAGDAAVLQEGIRRQLARGLPDYMVPAHIVVLASLPTTPAGKLDRLALPPPGRAAASAYVAPATPAARHLADIWQSVLKIERIGQTDNFFELGADSLSCLQVMARLRGLDDPVLSGIKLRDLMLHPSIAALLGLDEAAGAAGALAPSLLLAMNEPCRAVPPLFCFHPGLGTVFDYQPLARRLQGQRAVYGLPCRMLRDAAHRDLSLEAMAEDYVRQVKEAQPQGRYHLLGWSLGGALAVLAAHRIEQDGGEIGFLGLVDPFVPGTEAPAGDDWLADLGAFIALVLPQHDTQETAQHLARWRTDGAEAGEAAAVAILATLDARIDRGRNTDYAGMEAEELGRMFQVARHLKTLSGQAGDLPALGVRPVCWWSSGRPQRERAALKRQIGVADPVETELSADHFGMMQAGPLLDQLALLLARLPLREGMA